MKLLLICSIALLFVGCKADSKFGTGGGETEKEVPVKGEKGDQGLKGDTGAKGDTGPKGMQGESGPIGPQGNDGAVGATGATGPRGATGSPGSNGRDGIDGKDGENAIAPQVYLTPVYNKCVKLMSGIYMKNEGDKADFYNNSSCSHGTNDDGVYCNNVTDGELGGDDREVCTIVFANKTMYRYTIVGRGEDMCVVEEKFINLPNFKTLD